MPVITQENGRATVKGLPIRWGARAYQELTAAQAGAVGAMPAEYKSLAALLDAVTDAPIPIDATDANLCMQAERFAGECASFSATIHDNQALRQRLAGICRLRGIQPPDIDDDTQVIRRCTDPAWWRRAMRKVHGRAFEHAAIRLGFVSSQQGKYASDESVKRRIAQNRRNAAALESVTMTNDETGQKFTLAELAAKGNGNKRIRRGELMMRMAGCEQIATELGHVGIFVTLTAPSKYHAVLQKSGKRNPNYNGATPLQAHGHLNTVWQRTRAQNGRDGVQPYGFRIAEPHHDGCAHWHMLMFMPSAQVAAFKANLKFYALQEYGSEAGASNTRVKFEQIDPAKGGAAGYMAKYVGKNIGNENDSENDIFGNQIITSEMRVDAWAGTWGIRQFQAIGQAPVTAWRELRRVPALAIEHAPAHVKAAHAACQRIETKDAETGEIVCTHAANWAEYLRAQGGVNLGRDYRIGVAAPVVMVEGRYGLTECAKPAGIYCTAEPEKIYQSTRYTWTQSGGGVRFCLPWSPVNNCTQDTPPSWMRDANQGEEIADYDPAEWFDSFDAEQMIFYQHEIDELKAQAGVLAGMHRDCTVWTRQTGDKHV